MFREFEYERVMGMVVLKGYNFGNGCFYNQAGCALCTQKFDVGF